MAFNNADKISINELTDELQELINSKASNVDLDRHTSLSSIHITTTERDTWNGMLAEAKKYTDDKIKQVTGYEGEDVSDSGSGSLSELIATKLNTSTFDEWKATLSQVAFSGSYNDLLDKPANVAFSDTANSAYKATIAETALVADKLSNMDIVIGPDEPENDGLWFDTTNSVMKCKYNGEILTTK